MEVSLVMDAVCEVSSFALALAPVLFGATIPVCVCVGGFCRYGIKESTLCSAAAGDMLCH